MYIRSTAKRPHARELMIPENYGGNAFSSSQPFIKEEKQEDAAVEGINEVLVDADISDAGEPDKKNGLWDFTSSDDDIILIGLILLLAFDGLADDILPILIMILLLGK